MKALRTVNKYQQPLVCPRLMESFRAFVTRVMTVYLRPATCVFGVSVLKRDRTLLASILNFFCLFSNFPPFSIFYRVYFRLIYRLSIPIWNFPKLSFPPKSYTSIVLIDYIIYHGYEIHPYKYSS